MKYEFSLDQRQIVLLVVASLGLGILIFAAGWLMGDIFRISKTPTVPEKTVIRSQRTVRHIPKAFVKIIKQKVPAIPKPQPAPVIPPAQDKLLTEMPEEIITESTVEDVKEADAQEKVTPPAPDESAQTSETDSDKEPIVAIAPSPAVLLYAVQVGAFLSKDNAGRFMRRLNQKDYQAYIFQETDAKKRVWHAVRIGSYQDLEAAKADAAAFKNKEKMPAIVMYFDSLNPVYLKKKAGPQ